jgi:diaminopropionate ammonia-lyase
VGEIELTENARRDRRACRCIDADLAGAVRRARLAADPGYAPTPLVARHETARRLGLAGLWVKDEGRRLAGEGLASFKAAGVMAALDDDAALDGAHTVVCASDGNYGRALAWAARRRGLACRIFLPACVSAARREAIRAQDAEVVIVEGGYDDAMAAARAACGGGVVEVSDTGYPGNERFPRAVSEGYSAIAAECVAAWPRGLAPPTHLFLPVGVGGLAGAMLATLRALWPGRMPRVLTVEPRSAAGLARSLRAGRVVSAPPGGETAMIGLACETPCTVGWRTLAAGVDWALAISDARVAEAMRDLAFPGEGEAAIVAGETGAACHAALLSAMADPAIARRLGLGAGARVLLPVTEGATDPVLYRRMVGIDPASVAARAEGAPGATLATGA